MVRRGLHRGDIGASVIAELFSNEFEVKDRINKSKNPNGKASQPKKRKI